MNKRKVFNVVGRIDIAISALLLLPAIVSLIYGESVCAASYFATAALVFVFGIVTSLLTRTKDHAINARDGFAIVALAWTTMSAFGALPFVLSGDIPSYIDAFFETVSGFTTTGASILTNVEEMCRGNLFWRSFTHWIGGMGVLVFVMAVLPNVSERSMHILRAEMPGPIVDKLVPKAKDTAQILYLMYIVLTVIETLFLLAGGMSLYESLIHAFGTAGTGGFSSMSDSISGYSPYIQWVITVFMLLFGINFNLYYLLLLGRIKDFFKSAELWIYFGIVALSVALITGNIYSMCSGLGEALRNSSFQVASIITTTGYATADFNLWPQFSKGILFLLMFIGGCAGSTAGGLKVSRVILLIKLISTEIKRMINPRSVVTLRFQGKEIDEKVQRNVAIYFAMYMVCFFAVFLLISLEPFGTETVISAVTACFNNVGPGFGVVGPMGSYADFSGFSKIVLSFTMLLGRLEIFPMLIAFSPKTWMKK